MKKLLLFVTTIVVANTSFAQSSLNFNSESNNPQLQNVNEIGSDVMKKNITSNPYGKSTGLSDTLYRVSTAQYDSLFVTPKFYYLGATLPLDSGFVFGINAPGWNGYAGRFKFNHLPDTTFKVTGVLAAFGGTYQLSTVKTIDFKVWGLDTNSVMVTSTRKMKNLPGATLATLNRNIKTLGISNTAANDTLREYFFPTAVTNLASNFYVGYEINYQWANLGGDTIGAYSCTQGFGWYHGEIQNIVGTDTIINAQTAIKDAGVWKDSYIQMGFNKLNMSIVPIFHYSGAGFWPSEVGGVTQNGLTFYGNYPNPAIDKVNIKFGLDKGTTVSLAVRDVTGKTVINVPAQKYDKGEHVVYFETMNLPVGNYVYVIRTGEGDAMAAQITVVK